MNFNIEVIEKSKEKIVVVDFWAQWCFPCKVLGPILEKTIAESEDKAVLVKIDVDEHREIANQHDISSIPSVMAFKNGVKVGEFLGARDPKFIKNWLNSL